MPARAFITGISGLSLTDAERAFLRDAQPWGVILFKRNIETPDQVRALTAACRDALGRDAPVFVDQEGGRVQRLSAPHWPAYPPARAFGDIYDRDRDQGLHAATLGSRLIASDLRQVGIDADCLPVADVPVAGADQVIGDRAYGVEPGKVAELAKAAADGLLAEGVLPVVKHVPGHGRATADSHHALPVVQADRATLEATDFAPFRALSSLPMAMTAHVVFSAIDPVAPVTTSAIMVRDVIRNFIGFQGLLMSDDVSMKALSGTLAERSTAALAAGCDVVLHCNGDMTEMEAVASASPVLGGEAGRRADAALSLRAAPQPFDVAQSRALFAQMMSPHAAGRLAS
jgi:beta-N-acetylhexosaminidase